MSQNESFDVLVEFNGGAELLFGNVRKLPLKLDSSSEWSLKNLIHHLRDQYLKQRAELFVSGDSVRPGILVLVNDTDWELLGDNDYIVQPNDNILFISTLHGG